MTSRIIIPQEVMGQGPQVFMPAQTMQTTTTSNARNLNMAGLITGVLQILIGIIEVTTTAIAIGLGTFYRWGWGIWAGVGLYGLGGVIGMISAWNNRDMMMIYMVFSIISSIVAPCHMIYDAVASSHRGDFACVCGFWFNSCREYLPAQCDTGMANGLQVVHGIAATVAAVEMIVALVAACSVCCTTGCGTPSNSGVQQPAVIVQYAQGPQPQTLSAVPHQFTYPSTPVNHGYY